MKFTNFNLIFVSFFLSEDTRQSYNRPHSAITTSSKPHHVGGGKKKKKHIFGPQPPRPAFSTSTGEQIHSAWDLDDELL
jgi:hypothetical protein